MRDLRLIGVHEDGEHLLIADADGGRFRLPIDDALRAAARRDRPRLGQLQIEIEGGMRPREVQALIRRGLTADEVAERSGWTVEKVQRFEGPILAEREHVARKARQCAVGTRGSAPLTLEDRATERLRERGVDVDRVEWDSARDTDGVWQLLMHFAAGGRRRTAAWRYEPLGGSVAAANDEARWLGDEATSGFIPTPHQAATPGGVDVYDVDADGGLEPAERERRPDEPIDLMAAMREHSARGRRARRRPSPSQTPGEERPREDALPLESLAGDLSSTPPPPASRARKPATDHLDEPTGSAELVGGWPEDAEARHDARHGRDERESRESRESPARGASAQSTGRENGARTGATRRGRPSVPSWDDIVFGTKGSGPA
ncbi:septation protein SepH [Nostocoides sp. Soil756]|jgi:hypothetical protein|uniref:septation protein SepH n=1 Tax=Nostocoides sp. Soil756 TaxID=1736399 RepID=UPI0006F241CA|nr:septation protein SepH [Tetrasphaera sp. Soil756]KRE62991.1 hypothetical protein ASG78_08575 [Tetrasphaera sp. Soil756]